MNSLFPMGFPPATAFYLILYVLTLVIHVLFMNYVLAGAGYLAVVGIFPGRDGRRWQSPPAVVLRDWLPFMLSGAITAGVAPLLFVQILYQPHFYTANLLLFHRWMAILPVLIIGFYLLYVLKSKTMSHWPRSASVAAGVLAFACFAFTAYSWTENHLLSVRGQPYWAQFYGSHAVVHFEPTLLPRLGMWFLGAMPTMVMMVAWQLWYLERRGQATGPTEPRRAAVWALMGLGAAAAAAVVYYLIMDSALSEQAFHSRLAEPYLHLALGGFWLQAFAWVVLARRQRFEGWWLSLSTVGCLATILGMTVVRESIRLVNMDIQPLLARHQRAAEMGGLVVFLLFFVINAGLVAWCFHLVRQARPRQRPA